MEISADFDAPPEVVYNSLTDPDRADRWLPSGVRLERLDGDRVRVEAGRSASEYQVSMDAADFRLTWRSTGPNGLDGSVRVEDQPAGGSTVHVVVATGGGGPSPDAVRRGVDEAMRHLARDVSDNFTAG